MSTSAALICAGALGLVGAVDPEDTIGSAMMADAFRRLNLMMGQWSLQDFTIPVEAREVFPMIAGKGAPATPYTVGPGGDCDTTRPAALSGAGLLLNASLPVPVEIPRAVLTDAAYRNLRIKDLSSSLFTDVYYNPTFAAGLGSLYLFPVPNNTLNALVLYRPAQLGRFSSLVASYDLPDGADEPIEYNLARRLLTIYSVPLQAKLDLIDLAKTSLAIYKRSNVNLSDQPIDPMFLPGGRGRRQGGYNILTGNQ